MIVSGCSGHSTVCVKRLDDNRGILGLRTPRSISDIAELVLSRFRKESDDERRRGVDAL
jgi:hypothetical protein